MSCRVALLIWVSLGTSKRGTVFDMFGDISLERARKSNIHLSRAAMLILLCVARQIWWAAEQPGSSRLPKLPFFPMHRRMELCCPIWHSIRTQGRHCGCPESTSATQTCDTVPWQPLPHGSNRAALNKLFQQWGWTAAWNPHFSWWSHHFPMASDVFS